MAGFIRSRPTRLIPRNINDRRINMDTQPNNCPYAPGKDCLKKFGVSCIPCAEDVQNLVAEQAVEADTE
jgi:hypothetical protein